MSNLSENYEQQRFTLFGFLKFMGPGTNLVSNWEQNMLYTKNWQILHRKRISMFADLKESSLGCKCYFYRPEHNAKEDTMKLNI